jgi:hypothetical protein
MASFADRLSLPAAAPTGPFFAPAAQPQTTVTPATVTTRADFERVAARRYGVATVRTGTQAEQETALTPNGGTTTPIRIPNWQSWEPQGEDFQRILDAFDDVAGAFGGVPPVREIVFYDMSYGANQAGVVTARPRDGASYGAGQLTIYRAATTMDAGIPVGRSVASGQYPNAPVVSIGSAGSSPGAPVPWPDHAENVRRVIVHELGHGLAEAGNAAQSVANPSGSGHPMTDEFAREVGWVGNRLMNLGPNGAPTAQEITPDHWNDPAWTEQPVSRYAVAGGLAEDFAESVMAYVRQPNVLLARSPRRYRFIDQRKSQWQSQLRPVTHVGDFPEPRRDRVPV